MSTKKGEIHLTFSPTQTKNLGKKIAEKILQKRFSQRAVVLALEGSLGAGKTTFLQGFAKGIGIEDKILSPTFVILKKFKIPVCITKQNDERELNSKFKNFYHIDCYRIKQSKELSELGFEKIISNPKNIICIEWADKIKKILPRDTIWLKFEVKNKNQRKITLKDKKGTTRILTKL